MILKILTLMFLTIILGSCAASEKTYVCKYKKEDDKSTTTPKRPSPSEKPIGHRPD